MCDVSQTLVHCQNSLSLVQPGSFSLFQLLHVVFILQLVNHISVQVASVIMIRVCECTYLRVRVHVHVNDMRATCEYCSSYS